MDEFGWVKDLFKEFCCCLKKRLRSFPIMPSRKVYNLLITRILGKEWLPMMCGRDQFIICGDTKKGWDEAVIYMGDWFDCREIKACTLFD